MPSTLSNPQVIRPRGAFDLVLPGLDRRLRVCSHGLRDSPTLDSASSGFVYSLLSLQRLCIPSLVWVDGQERRVPRGSDGTFGPT